MDLTYSPIEGKSRGYRAMVAILGVMVAVIGVVSIIPYLQLQLTGLGFIVEVSSNGAIRSNVAILLAFVLTCAFVFTSGIRGAAWVSGERVPLTVRKTIEPGDGALRIAIEVENLSGNSLSLAA